MTLPADSGLLAVDPAGLVVYFRVNGKPLLFNGHKGILYDTLPGWAQDALERLRSGGTGTRTAATPRRPRSRTPAARFERELERLRGGEHPDLEPEPRQTRFRWRQRPLAFNVYTAQACNLACRYCFNQGGTFGRRRVLMSPATAREVVALVKRSIQGAGHRRVHVTLFGGEPLLAPEAVLGIARGLQDLNHQPQGAEVRLILSTNGTIYNRRVFRVLAERPDLCTIVVSLDARRAAHDANRPFARSGRGSFALVRDHVRRLKEEGLPYSVTCVIPPPYEYIAAAEGLIREGIDRFELKDWIPHVYGAPGPPADLQREFALWRRNYLAYTDYYLDHLRDPHRPTHVDRQTLVSDYGEVLDPDEGCHRTLACGLADLKVGVAADGRLFPCESLVGHAQFELGDVRRGFDPDKWARFEQWILRTGQWRLDHLRCRGCFAKLACGGGCYAMSYDRTGHLTPCEESACRFIKEKVRIDLYYLARLKAEHPAVFRRLGGLLP